MIAVLLAAFLQISDGGTQQCECEALAAEAKRLHDEVTRLQAENRGFRAVLRDRVRRRKP